MKRIKDKNFNIKTYLIAISLVLYLVFAYNISLQDYIYINKIVLLISLIVPIFIMGIMYKKRIIKLLPLTQKMYIIAVVLLGIILIRNGDLINGHMGLPFYYTVTIILYLILCNSNNWIKIALNIILLFTIEHIICTWIFYFFPDFYINNVLPLFPEMFHSDLLYQFEHNQVAGLTYHYSTNGIYLAIGVIVTWALLLEKDSNKFKKIFIAVLFVLGFGALLLTGKRAHLLFSVLAIICIFFVKNGKAFKKSLVQIILIAIIGVCIIGITSIFIPEINNTMNRMIESIKYGDISNGRQPLYEIAINNFKSAPIIGHGWGKYKYTYPSYNINGQLNDSYEYMDAHNIYLQLLSEIGILGTIIILLILFSFLIRTIKIINLNNINSLERKSLLVSLGIQVFVLLYGFTGNPIYDVQVFFIYMIALAMYSSIKVTVLSTISKSITKVNANSKIIGILTFNDTNDYGTELQKYALMKNIENYGFNCEVIDYRCDAFKNTKTSMNIIKYFKQNKIKDILKNVFISDSKFIKAIKFKNFDNKYVYTSSVVYDKKNIEESNKKYNDFIVGGNLVWNMSVTNSDYTFLLDFVDDNTKKKSYAASFGYKEIPEHLLEKNKELFNKFEVLNVCQKHDQDILTLITDKSVNITLDPILLLSSQEWNKLLENYIPLKNDYILVYLPENSKEVFLNVRKLAKKEKCKIIYIHNSFRNKIKMKSLRTASPIDFVGLIKNAKYIVTGSYYAICLSILFEKEFFYTKSPFMDNDSRMENLVKFLNLQNREINNLVNEKINYKDITELIEEKRKNSKEIITRMIERDK